MTGSSDTDLSASALYPRRAIDAALPAAKALKEGRKVCFLGKGTERYAEELSVKCNYDRPRLENVCKINDVSEASEGDVILSSVPADGAFVLDDNEMHSVCEIVERRMFGRIAVFFDRDDTIVKDVGHCRRAEDIHVFPFVPQALKRLNDAGLLTVMITNQSVIGRGWLDLKGLEEIHDKLRKDLEPGRIDDIFFCPHAPDEGCDCRKPKIGMALQALKKYDIDTFESFMIGDADKDIQFGESIGCRGFKVSEDYTFEDAVDDILALIK